MIQVISTTVIEEKLTKMLKNYDLTLEDLNKYVKE